MKFKEPFLTIVYTSNTIQVSFTNNKEFFKQKFPSVPPGCQAISLLDYLSPRLFDEGYSFVEIKKSSTLIFKKF